MEGWRIKQ